MRMVGTEVVSAALHAVDPEPDSGSHLEANGEHHLDHHGDHGENASSGSNEDLNGDGSPIPPHSTQYDSSDGAILVKIELLIPYDYAIFNFQGSSM